MDPSLCTRSHLTCSSGGWDDNPNPSGLVGGLAASRWDRDKPGIPDRDPSNSDLLPCRNEIRPQSQKA